MCLSIDDNQKKPWNSNKFRWKVYIRCKHGLVSPFQNTLLEKGWNTATLNNLSVGQIMGEVYGFHVFVSRKDARAYAKRYTQMFHSPVVVQKIAVRGHLKSGYFRNLRSETWKQIKLAPRLKSKGVK